MRRMGKFLGILAALAVLTLLGTTALALTTTLTEKGVLVDTGAGGAYMVPFPGIGTGDKCQSPTAVKVTANTATGQYENGATFSTTLETDGTLVFKFAALPESAKHYKFNMSLPLSLKDGGTFAVDGAAPVPFPAAATSDAFLFKNNGQRLLITPGKGGAFVIAIEHGWQQVMDLRVWKTNAFAWIAFADVVRSDGASAVYTLKVYTPEAQAAQAKAAAAPLVLPPLKLKELAENGATRIEKWPGGKRAAFLLAFDDSCQTHIHKAMPELKKRNLPGTFYINPGNGPYKNEQKAWEALAHEPLFVLANHTFTHAGVADAAALETDIARCNAVINQIYPDKTLPRLIGFGTPGGVPWKVTADEFQAALARHHLVNRPSFYGPPFHLKTAADCLAVINNALVKGDMGHLDFHGIGGDWHVTSMEIFTAIVDKLAAEKDRIWTTDVVSWHQYVTERNTAAVQVLAAEAGEIRLTLSSKADPQLYDRPLTLTTRVDPAWKQCTITQGQKTWDATADQGMVQYDACPGSAPIVLRPAKL